MLAPAASTLKTERELAAILEPSALTAGLGRKEEREERIAKVSQGSNVLLKRWVCICWCRTLPSSRIRPTADGSQKRTGQAQHAQGYAWRGQRGERRVA